MALCRRAKPNSDWRAPWRAPAEIPWDRKHPINEHFSLACQGGVDYVDDSGLHRSGAVGKFTVAPQASLGDRFFSRPVIRAFLTCAIRSDSFRGQAGDNDYANDTSGWT